MTEESNFCRPQSCGDESILRGREYEESYRLSTFKNRHVSAFSPNALAKAGFLVTDSRTIRCFSCGTCNVDMTGNGDLYSDSYHTKKCLMRHNEDPRNVPIGKIVIFSTDPQVSFDNYVLESYSTTFYRILMMLPDTEVANR